MWMVDAIFTKPRTLQMNEMTLLQAAWIGAAQILSAVFPGTSRSMLHDRRGPNRRLIAHGGARVSFFLSMPTMAVANRLRFAQDHPAAS